MLTQVQVKISFYHLCLNFFRSYLFKYIQTASVLSITDREIMESRGREMRFLMPKNSHGYGCEQKMTNKEPWLTIQWRQLINEICFKLTMSLVIRQK